VDRRDGERQRVLRLDRQPLALSPVERRIGGDHGQRRVRAGRRHLPRRRPGEEQRGGVEEAAGPVEEEEEEADEFEEDEEYDEDELDELDEDDADDDDYEDYDEMEEGWEGDDEGRRSGRKAGDWE